VFIAITSKAYPSRYIYGSPDGSTKGVLAGASARVHACARMRARAPRLYARRTRMQRLPSLAARARAQS